MLRLSLWMHRPQLSAHLDVTAGAGIDLAVPAT
jgi:hypothetical protein